MPALSSSGRTALRAASHGAPACRALAPRAAHRTSARASNSRRLAGGLPPDFMASAVSKDAKQLSGTPIPTDVDPEQPVAIRDGEFGGMVLPQKNLKAESLAKANDQIVPIGQLWLLKLGPMKDGAAISRDKLRLATIKHDGDETTVPQCALGVRKASTGTLELLVFGKDKEPILKLPMKSIEGGSGPALDVSAERDGDEGKITLKLLGKYEAKLRVTELEM